MNESKKHLELALELAQEASQYVLAAMRQPIRPETKADHSLVTETALHVDELIRHGIQKKFPKHSLLTEEFGLIENGGSDFLWVIDPLDGTKAFANRLPGFCVMIGLLFQGEPYLGVVADPLEGHVYEALRGQGTYHRWHGKREALRVSKRHLFHQMPLIISTGFPSEKLQSVLEKLGTPCLPPINSVGIKIGAVVRQEADIYLNHHGVHYWDTCAPQVILEEAGGKFTKIDGQHLEYLLDQNYDHRVPTIASNGTRHEEIIELVQEIIAPAVIGGNLANQDAS